MLASSFFARLGKGLRFINFIFLGLALGLVAVACSEQEPSTKAKPRHKPPDIALPSFVSRGYREGTLSWKLVGQQGQLYAGKKKQSKTVVRDFVLYNYDKEGRLTSTIRARKGVIRQKKSLVRLTGTVVVEGADDTVLRTEQLDYNQKKEEFFTQEKVVISRGSGHILKGKGMRANKDLTRLEILSQVSGRRE
jgi:LPS export ABC transporter protein LptC